MYVSPQDPWEPEYSCLAHGYIPDIWSYILASGHLWFFYFLKNVIFFVFIFLPVQPKTHVPSLQPLSSLPKYDTSTTLVHHSAFLAPCVWVAEHRAVWGRAAQQPPGACVARAFDISLDSGPPSVAVCSPQALSCQQLLTPTSGLASLLTQNTEHVRKHSSPSAWAPDPQ